MLIGIIVGAIMTIIASVIGEVRVIKERQEQGRLLESFGNKCEEHEKLQEKHEEMRIALKDLIDSSIELTHDYAIIAGILEKEIGKEESWKRYEEKKNEKPKDINELFAEIKARKGE